ncbi:MAG: glycosyltransferase [Geminicoccaceae bacterium]|nr:glycosyltransferase [Geminicoccaceae bacterium]
MSSTGPRVSVVIAAFNAEASIGRAIRSVLASAAIDVEVLVVDDGSRDRTAGLVREIAADDRRVRLIETPANGGPARARNLGIEHARGEWLAILDADDAFRPGRLASLLRIARASGATMVADNLRLVDPAGRVLATAMAAGDRALWSWIAAETFIRRNLFNGRGFRFGYLKPIIRRQVLSANGIRYDQDLKVAEDYHLYLDCFLAGGTMALTPAPLYDYTQTPGSTSRALGRADVERLLAANAEAIEHTSGELRAALTERQADIRTTLAHMRFLELIKARRPLDALGTLARRPAAWPVALRGGRESVAKRFRRLIPTPSELIVDTTQIDRGAFRL